MSSLAQSALLHPSLITSTQRRRALLLLLATALLARSTPLQSPHDLLNGWRRERAARREERKRRERETPLNTPALEKKLVDLYIPDPSGSRTLLVPHMGRISKVRITPTPKEVYASHLASFPPLDPTERLGVNKKFWKMLAAILKIAFSSTTGKEAFLLVLHTFFLLARTVLSVMVARLDGRLVRDLVSANGAGFLRGLLWWFTLAIPSTYTNSMIRYLERKLALAFRTNLTRYIHDLYLNDNLNYYKFGIGLGASIPPSTSTAGQKAKSTGGDTNEAAAGTADHESGESTGPAGSLLTLFGSGNIGKPVLDIAIFTSQLAAALGPVGTIGLFANYGFTAWILKKATPAFGKMAATQARLEGDYRAGLSRIGRDGEEVAFYNGGKREKGILWAAYERLTRHVHSVFKIRIPYGMTEDFVIKYFWSACGYVLMSIPILFPAPRKVGGGAVPLTVGHEVAERTESYVSNRRLLISLADAGGRLMYSGKDLAELSGYTSRVYALLSSLHSLDNSIYTENPRPAGLTADQPFYDMSNVSGEIIIGPKHLLLRGVPIVAPAGGVAGATRGGEELIHSLDLRVEKGEHTLITGPNGVGKTSIARIVAQLWPTWAGQLERPVHGEGGLFFLPQRPYLSIGSLRDQVIYPHSYAEMKSRGRTDSELMSILEQVHLAYLPSREGGWETRKEWKDVLSGGEKQRMGMARLFYHRPSFAILDECTSAVSSDVEGLMYEHAKSLDITLVTISHRPSLLKYHNRHLRLGDTPSAAPGSPLATHSSTVGPIATPSTPLASQGWQLTALTSTTAEEKLELDLEIERIEKSLRDDVESWEKRLGEVNTELSGRANRQATVQG
nr:uncharacterized protein CI109_000767 [Kwoniella shandongensis]KAA5530589.1 hypothetical protein CI109_000767 [Kwoniella shandongensis]